MTGNADYIELQGLVDAAIENSGTVFIGRNYKIDRPLMVAKWDGLKYVQVCIEMYGNGRMWDNGKQSVIETTFNDAPAICVQVGKGCYFHNFTIKMPGHGIDKQFAVQAGIAFEAFGGVVPADGGYTNYPEYYRGGNVRTGSTGCSIKDVTVINAITGFVTSINGYTQNCDLLDFTNIRLQYCKYGWIGCQAQEKQNTITNVGVWTKMDTLFMFNKYGAKQPGHWIIDRGNLAGGVRSIVHRISSGWGPMTMRNIFAESLETIGTWVGGSGDMMSECFINLNYPEVTGAMPQYAMDAWNTKIKDCNIRYYGRQELPVLLYRAGAVEGGSYYQQPIVTKYGHDAHPKYRIDQNFYPSTSDVLSGEVVVQLQKGTAIPGQLVLFMQKSDWSFQGQGLVKSVSGVMVTIQYISRNITNLTNYRIGLYEKTTNSTALSAGTA